MLDVLFQNNLIIKRVLVFKVVAPKSAAETRVGLRPIVSNFVVTPRRRIQREIFLDIDFSFRIAVALVAVSYVRLAGDGIFDDVARYFIDKRAVFVIGI